MRSSRNWIKLVIVASISISSFAYSAQVLKVIPGNQHFIAVSFDKNTKWRLNESICLAKKRTKAIEETDLIGCGQVIRITRVGMIVALDGIQQTIVQGEQINLRATERATSAQNAELSIIQSKYEGFSDTKAVLFGVNLLSPYVRFEQLVFPWLGIGVTPTYLLKVPAGNGTLSGPAVLGSFSYYPYKPFQGFHANLSIGGGSITATTTATEESALGMIVSPSCGWRFHWESGVDVGFGAGINYFRIAKLKTSDIDFFGISPFAFFDFGITF